MSVIYLIFLIIFIVWFLCSLASIIQFFIDLHKNSTMCKDLQSALKRAKRLIGTEEREDNG